jgi:hypothetical protein
MELGLRGQTVVALIAAFPEVDATNGAAVRVDGGVVRSIV